MSEFASYRRLLELGVTTWPEDPATGRSDCHAWSNAASYHLIRTVLGVSVLEPGCARLRIAPHLAGLAHVSGAFVTPRGPALVEYASGDLRVTLPDGVRATVVWAGAERDLGPGTHAFAR